MAKNKKIILVKPAIFEIYNTVNVTINDKFFIRNVRSDCHIGDYKYIRYTWNEKTKENWYFDVCNDLKFDARIDCISNPLRNISDVELRTMMYQYLDDMVSNYLSGKDEKTFDAYLTKGRDIQWQIGKTLKEFEKSKCMRDYYDRLAYEITKESAEKIDAILSIYGKFVEEKNNDSNIEEMV